MPHVPGSLGLMGRGLGASAIVRLLRPGNAILAASGTLVGEALAAGGWGSIAGPASVAAPVAAACITAFGNVLNDLRDIEVDRTSHPDRPLPSGKVRPRTAWRLMVLLLTAGLAFAALAGTVAFLVAAAVVGLLFAYEAGLKRTGLPGNVAVAALTAATFPFGAVAVGTPWSRLPWVLAAMALFVNLAREVAKDIQDMAGDRGHRSTVPMRVGRGGAAVLATAAAAGGALVSWPFLEALVAGGEAALVAPAWTVAAADVVAVAGAAMSAAWPAAGQRLLKAAMAATLLAAAVRAGAGPPA